MWPNLVVPVAIAEQMLPSHDSRLEQVAALGVPLLHQRPNDSFGLPIRPGVLHLGERVACAVLCAPERHGVIGASFVFAPIVRIYAGD